MSANPDDRDDNTDVFVGDDEGLVDRERRKVILARRQDIDDILAESKQLEMAGRINHGQAVELVHGAVVRFLVRIEPLLRNEQIDESQYYYEEVELGTLDPAPPPIDLASGERIAHAPKAVPVPIRGLRQIITFDPFWQAWTYHVSPKAGGGWALADGERDTRTSQSRIRLPMDVLKNSVRAADAFLDEIGLGLDYGGEIDEQANPF